MSPADFSNWTPQSTKKATERNNLILVLMWKHIQKEQEEKDLRL